MVSALCPSPCSAAPEEVRASGGNTWNHDSVSQGQSQLSDADDKCWGSFPSVSLHPLFPVSQSHSWLRDLVRCKGRWRKGEEREEKLIFLACFLTPKPTGGVLWAPKVLSQYSFGRQRRSTSSHTHRQPLSCRHPSTDNREHMYEYMSKPEWVILQPPAATSASGLTHFLQLRCGSNNPCSALHLA